MKISVIRARVIAVAATLTVAATLAAVPASFAGASTKTAASGSASKSAAATAVTLPDVLDTWVNNLEPNTNYDALEMTYRSVKVNKDPDCEVCGKKPTVTSATLSL